MLFDDLFLELCDEMNGNFISKGNFDFYSLLHDSSASQRKYQYPTFHP